MLCQFCGKREAENKLRVNFMGLNRELFLCDECMSRVKEHAEIPEGFDDSFTMPGFRERNSRLNPFKTDAGEEIKTKRKLNQLHKQLSSAVKSERYEEAAELRDKINEIKKEVYINGK